MNNSTTNFSDRMSLITVGIFVNVQGLLELNARIRRLTIEKVRVFMLLNNIFCHFVLGPQFISRKTNNFNLVDFSVNYWVITNISIVMIISIDQFYVTMDQRHEHLNMFKIVKTVIFIVVTVVSAVAIISNPYPAPNVGGSHLIVGSSNMVMRFYFTRFINIVLLQLLRASI